MASRQRRCGLKWLRTAIRNLDHQAGYFAERNPQAARDAVGRIEAAVSHPADHPHLGRIGRLPMTRELIVGGTPWVIVYRVRGSVEILRVLHTAQDWPPRRR